MPSTAEPCALTELCVYDKFGKIDHFGTQRLAVSRRSFLHAFDPADRELRLPPLPYASKKSVT